MTAQPDGGAVDAIDQAAGSPPGQIPVVVFGPQAKVVADQLAKGHRVAVEGRLASRKVKTGEHTTTTVNVIARRVEFLGRPKETNGQSVTIEDAESTEAA